MKRKILAMLVLVMPILVSGQYFGQKHHPMNSSSDNMDILKYWKNKSEEEIKTYETLYGMFSADKNTSYREIASADTYKKLIAEQHMELLGGPMLGDVHEDGVSVWVRTAKPSKVQIELSSGNKSILSDVINTTADNDFAGIIKLKGLKAGTSYSYKVVIDDEKRIADDNFHFTTLPKVNDNKSISIAFGSCPHRWGLGNENLWNTIKCRNPSAMLLLGDIAAQDRDNNLALHRADYLLRDSQKAWKEFACNVPVYANWDDHDYFANDKAGIPAGFTDEDRRNVRGIFMNSWVNPSYGLQDEGIYFKTQIGPAEVIMTDNRYFRENKNGVFLGKTQMDWLKKQIANCKSPFLILSCGTMWSDFVSEGKDSWGEIDPKGREEIFDLIEQSCVSGVLFISGDRHGARGFSIERKSGFKMYEFEMASLGARVGPPKSDPKWKTQLYGIDGTFAFGEFTFNQLKDQQQVVFRMIKDSGEVLFEKAFLHSDLKPKK